MDPTEFGEIMEVSDLVAVHLTRYFPEKGTIKTLNSIFPQDTLRNTVHFSINHPVENIGFYGSWDETKYTVIVPLGDLCRDNPDKIRNFNVVDTYFTGDVKLPSSTVVLASPLAYEDLLQQMLCTRDELLSHVCDDCYGTTKPFNWEISYQNLTIQIAHAYHNCLREETRKEISKRGYKVMPGGMWNWGSVGANVSDQRRIAQQLGTHYGRHCDDFPLQGLEFASHLLANLARGKERAEIEAFLKARDRTADDYELDRILESEPIAGRGWSRLTRGHSEPNLPMGIGMILKVRESLPPEFRDRVDIFMRKITNEFREFIPSPVIERYRLPINDIA